MGTLLALQAGAQLISQAQAPTDRGLADDIYQIGLRRAKASFCFTFE